MCGKKKYLGALVLLFASVHFSVFAQSESEVVVPVATEPEIVVEDITTETIVPDPEPQVVDIPSETLQNEDLQIATDTPTESPVEVTDLPTTELESVEEVVSEDVASTTDIASLDTLPTQPTSAQPDSSTSDATHTDDFLVTQRLPDEDTEVILEEAPEAAEEAIPPDVESDFKLLNPGSHFRLDEQIVFIFSTGAPAPSIPEELSEVGFIEEYVEPIIDGVIEYSKDIVEHVVSATEVVVDAVSDLLVPDSEVRTQEGVVVTEDVRELESDTPQESFVETKEKVISEVLQDIPIADTETVDVATYVSELGVYTASSTQATTSGSIDASGVGESAALATVTPAIPVVDAPFIFLLDSLPVSASVVWNSDTEYMVILPTLNVSPGEHTFSATYTRDDRALSTTTSFTFGGNIDSVQKLSDEYTVVVEDDQTRGSVLWLLDMTNVQNVYQELATGELYEHGSPITYKEGNIFWLSHEGRSIVGYDTLARTVFSQSHEERPEVGIMLQTGLYIVDADAQDFSFDPTLPAE